MQLLQKNIYISRIQEGSRTGIERDQLTINPLELENHLKKYLKYLVRLQIEIINQDDEKRITRVFDVIEPRKKIHPADSDYPGVIGEIADVGVGETVVLKNVAVVICDKRKKGWKPIIEHTVHFEAQSIYSRMNLLCIEIEESEGIAANDYYLDLLKSGLYLSTYLCRTEGVKRYDSEEMLSVAIPDQASYRVGYFFQLCSGQYSSEKSGPILLGKKAENFLPTIVYPTMAIDGAITRNFSEEGFDTYHIQNNSIIYGLLRDPSIHFPGVVVAMTGLNHLERQRNALIAAHLFKYYLKVDAIIMTKAFGGASNLDLECLAENLKKESIAFVPIIQVTSAENKLSDSLLFKTDIFQNIVCSGWTHEKVHISEKIDCAFGRTDEISEGTNLLEIEYVKGIIDNLGSNRLSVVES